MKMYKTLLAGGLILAGLGVTVPQALATEDVTDSVKQGYQELKHNVKGMVNDLTGNDKTDAQKYMDQRKEDMKEYRDKVMEARKEYMQNRQEAQADYLKDHKQLPMKEDMKKDMEMSGAVQTTNVKMNK